MQYERKSFSVSMRPSGADDDDLARRWEETFGKKDRQVEPAKCGHLVERARWLHPCPACQNELLDELTRAAQECGEY